MTVLSCAGPALCAKTSALQKISTGFSWYIAGHLSPSSSFSSSSSNVLCLPGAPVSDPASWPPASGARVCDPSRHCGIARTRPFESTTVITRTDPPAYRKSRIVNAVSYTHLRAHETRHDLVCRLLLEK